MSDSYQQQTQSNVRDHENRRSPPTPLKLRGNYYALNTGNSLSRVPSSPLPPLPSFDMSDDFPTPNSYNDGETSYSRGIGRFDRIKSEPDDTTQILSSERMPMNRISGDADYLPDFAPVTGSPPKLRLSFESNITEAGSRYDLETAPDHRVPLKPAPKGSNTSRSSPPERIITAPVLPNLVGTNSQSRVRTTPSNSSQLRRSSAIYNRRRMSLEATEGNSSIKSGKSTLDSPEDHDSGFHEDFDEGLRSKQSSPDKYGLTDRNGKNHNSVHQRGSTYNPNRAPGQGSTATTPERAPLISSGDRPTSITLVDPGVTKKSVRLDLPQMEQFKETFSANLFENTLPPVPRRAIVLGQKPGEPASTRASSSKPMSAAKNSKVVTPAEFERLRQQADDESDEDDEEEDVARDESFQADLEKQRRRQQAALSIYRQQMTKVVGANTSSLPIHQRHLAQVGEASDADDESDEIPLGILMAHGFPQTNNRPATGRPATSQARERVVLEPKIRTPSPGNLPIFAKNLPVDPHAAGLPRSSSVYDLRAASRASMINSPPPVPLLDSYHTRQRKGAMFVDSNAAMVDTPIPMVPQDQSYFNQRPASQYEVIGMQPVPGQGMIQYVPVVVNPALGSPNVAPMQPPTLMHELIDRQYGAQRQLSRMSQYIPQYQQTPVITPPLPPPPPPPPQISVARPLSIYQDPRRSIYDQKSIYSSTSQQPTARPKLPSNNPAYRTSTASNSNARRSGRYRASTYAGSGLGAQGTDPHASPTAPDEDDAGWESLRRKKEEMQARRMSRMQTAA